MSYLYICEHGVKVGIKDNRVVATYQDGMTRSVPIESLEEIELFGNS